MKKRNVAGAVTKAPRVLALAIGALLVLGPVGTAGAAEVASSASNSSATDKIRCHFIANNTPSSGSRTGQGRCYWDDSRTAYGSLAGTDLTNVTNTAPNWRLLPLWSFSSCTGNQVAIGPQIGANSLSGAPIPVGGVEYKVTGCSGTSTSSIAGTLRLGYTGSDTVDSATCNRSGNCLWTTGDSSTWGSYPPDYFPGGALGGESFCGAVVTTDLDFDHLLTVGDVVEFTTVRTPSLTGEVAVSWWYPSAAGTNGLTSADVAFQQISPDGAIPTTVETSVTMRGAPSSGNGTVGFRRLGSVWLRCLDSVTQEYIYKQLDQESLLPAPGEVTPCSIARLFWPEPDGEVLDGDELTWRLQYSGILDAANESTEIESVEYAFIDPEISPVPRFDTLTWIETDPAGPWALGSSETFDIEMEYDGTLLQIVFRCTDWSGVSYDRQWLSAVRTAGDGSGLLDPDSGACVERRGIGLSPSSWVPYLVDLGRCVMVALFVPSESDVNGLKESAEAISEKAPIVWVVEAYGLMTSSVEAYEDSVAASGGCFEPLPGEAFSAEADDVSICDTDVPAGIRAYRPFVAFVFWLFFALAIFKDAAELIGR